MAAPPTPPPAIQYPPVPIIIAEITSPLIFGILFSWGLTGILIVQTYIYYLCFPKDKISFKILVYTVFLLDIAQTAMTGADAWYWFGKNFGNVAALSNVFISAYDTPMLGSIIAVIVQWFFCYRIWSLSKSWIWSIFVALVALLGGAAGLVNGIRGATVKNFAVARAHIDLVALHIWLIGSAVADVLIAGTLAYLLMRSKSTKQKQSSAVLYRIVRLTIETNAISASIAVICLILYFAFPTSNYFISPTFFLGKIYANTLLVTFNNRVFLRHIQSSTSQKGSNFSSSITSSSNSRMPFSPNSATHLQSQATTLADTEAYKMDTFSLRRSDGDDPKASGLGRHTNIGVVHVSQEQESFAQ